ncbi:MAG: nucleotide-binding protein [Nitrospirae bacterium]|nr:nucleotide-binding protein [Nitrospirota bacterium]
MIYCELLKELSLLNDRIKNDRDAGHIWQVDFYSKEYNTLVNRFVASAKSDGNDYTGIQLLGGDALAHNSAEMLQLLDQLHYKSEQLCLRLESLCSHNIIGSKNKPRVPNAKSNSSQGNIFIIHGHNEAKRRELKEIIKDDFHLNPVVLLDEPDGGSLPIIEKIEKYAPTCSYAIAVFTPDDVVEKNGEKYLQARPNVIFELGWFCAHRGRSNVMILLQDGTHIFSDFDGIIQKRFVKNVKEVYKEIETELRHANIIS